MAKRGNAGLGVISTEEQWKNCLSKPGLSLFDIYSECWGPCHAIQPTFRQLQMEFGDELSIMLAETDNIDELNKFRGTSQPLFLLYCKGVPIGFLKGANQPKLLDLVRRCSKDQKENKKIVNIFEDPTPEEEALARTMSQTSQKSATELSDFTLALIKPDAVKAGFVPDIISELNDNGLIVISQQEHTMTAEEVDKFYSHLTKEPYFLNLVDYMTSGPCVALVLAKVNPSARPVCELLKELRGPKDVACAKQENPTSLRAKFGVQTDSGVENAIHSSDSSETAANELAFFFPNFKNDTVGLERTLCIIRPDTNKQYKEKILARLQDLGFSIALQREFVMTRTMAETFYRKHREEEFFEALVAQMISGPSLVLALCSKDAVKQWRSYLGPTLVPEAKANAPESLRATFTTDDTINGLHGSSTAEEAADELNFFFPAEQTVAVIKPDMMDRKEEVLRSIEEAGIVIQAQKTVILSKDEAGSFYDEHKNKEFYGDLCSYMASGESTFLILSANNAVEKWRDIMGPTDPNEAKTSQPQSLRSKLGKDILKNGVHGSSSVEHALKSIEQIFGASMTIRSSKSKSLMSSGFGLNTSEGIAEIGSVQGVTDKTENDVCSDLPTDTPKESSSQRTLTDAQDLPELPLDKENEERPKSTSLSVKSKNVTGDGGLDKKMIRGSKSVLSVYGQQSKRDIVRSEMSLALAQSQIEMVQSKIDQTQSKIDLALSRVKSVLSPSPASESGVMNHSSSQVQLNEAQSAIIKAESLIESVKSQIKQANSHEGSQSKSGEAQLEGANSQIAEAQSAVVSAESLIEQAHSSIDAEIKKAQSQRNQPQSPHPEESLNTVQEPEKNESSTDEAAPGSCNPVVDGDVGAEDNGDNVANTENVKDGVECPEKEVESNLEEQPENEGTPAEEQQGEHHATQEETQENSGEEVTKKPPNIDCEEVHNNDGESGEALQPSMTNMSEGLSPISEGQEDYFQDSFNSDSSALREARETAENDVTMTNTPDQTGDELEEIPADTDKEGTPAPPTEQQE